MSTLEKYIDIGISEAKKSLQEGNSGFGAVVIRGDTLIAKAHDTDKTSGDPTAHAEINAIRMSSDKLGGDFSDCTLISTHEPCPMCSTAIAWAGFKQVAFGYSIEDALKQGRKRIDITCRELFQRAGVSIDVISDLKKEACSLLYNEKVRKNIKQLRNADSGAIEQLAKALEDKRVNWFNRQKIEIDENNLLDTAYDIFLKKLGISAEEAPIVERQPDRLVIHSRNFCPTLEACKILNLDTRDICSRLNEGPTQKLLQQLHPKLRFKRNYNHLRPYQPHCEEMIILEEE